MLPGPYSTPSSGIDDAAPRAATTGMGYVGLRVPSCPPTGARVQGGTNVYGGGGVDCAHRGGTDETWGRFVDGGSEPASHVGTSASMNERRCASGSTSEEAGIGYAPGIAPGYCEHARLCEPGGGKSWLYSHLMARSKAARAAGAGLMRQSR